MVFAEGIVRVHETLRILLGRGLNIPESVLRDGIENLLSSRALEACCECILKVTDEVVLLTVLEYGEFLVKYGTELLSFEGSLLLHLFEKS